MFQPIPGMMSPTPGMMSPTPMMIPNMGTMPLYTPQGKEQIYNIPTLQMVAFILHFENPNLTPKR